MAAPIRVDLPDDATPLTEREAALDLRMSVAWLRRKRLEGARNGDAGPPYVKLGNSVRYLRGDLRAYKAARRVDRSRNALPA